MELLGYIASFAMGIVLGLMGGGGSILTVPIMVYLFGFSPTAATGNSLFVVGITALIGSAIYIRKGDVDFKTGFSFAVPSVIGVNVARGQIVPNLPERILSIEGFVLTKEILIMAIFATLMIAASYSMIKKRTPPKPVNAHPLARSIVIACQGFFVGIVAGFVGAGGGFLIIPALVLFAGLSMRVAIGTSLMIIALQSLFGFAGDVVRGSVVDWPQMLTIAAVAAFGIIVGSILGSLINEQKMKTVFGWFVLTMGAIILFEQIRHLSL